MIDSINLIFTHQFLFRALVVGIMISLCCALLGVSLVLKRFSMIGDGLSHVGFGAMAIACVANVAPLYFSLPIVLISAFLLLRLNEKGKIKGDAAIALISTGALAIGIMATSMTTGMNVDIYNYMFGSILTMTGEDVVIAAVISAAVLILYIIFYDKIFAVTFDESFAQATGTKTSFYNMLIAGLTAVTIVIGMRMMGALLISSLIIFPTVTSLKLCKSFRSVVFSGAIISVICFLIGLIFSVEFEAPTGASIVCVNIYALLAFSAVSALKGIIKNTKLQKIFITVLSIALITAPFAVSGFSDSLITADDKLSVVTTSFAPYDFSREIVGDEGTVTMLLSPGEESHTYEPTPADIVKIGQCDIFVYGGGESEKWVDEILKSIDKDIKIIRMMSVTDLCQAEHDHEHTEENEEHNDNIINEHEEYDEHVWTSVSNARLIVDAICDAICEKDKDNSSFYINNKEELLYELEILDGKYRSLADKMKDKTVVIADRFPLRYLMLEYGISYKAAFPGCSAQAEVNPVTLTQLIDFIKNNGITKVFKVDLSTGNVASSISEATGTEVATLYSCHVITAEDFDGGEGYISLMTRNYEALCSSLY